MFFMLCVAYECVLKSARLCLSRAGVHNIFMVDMNDLYAVTCLRIYCLTVAESNLRITIRQHELLFR